MPYFNRLRQLDKTLSSFVRFYSERTDFELIIVDDLKSSKQETIDLFNLIQIYSKFFPVCYVKYMFNTYNPAPKFNFGAVSAKGEFLVVTNPECLHYVDILYGFDKEFDKSMYAYVVCGCKALKEDGTFDRWYQHSELRNKEYHFCSCLSSENYRRIGGFNEDYKDGWGYDDDSFRIRLKHAGIPFVLRDDLLVHHQYHDKVRPPKRNKLLEYNQRIFQEELLSLKQGEEIC